MAGQGGWVRCDAKKDDHCYLGFKDSSERLAVIRGAVDTGRQDHAAGSEPASAHKLLSVSLRGTSRFGSVC